MKVIALPESTERLLEMIKEEVRIEDTEEIIFNALLVYAKNIQMAKRDLVLPKDKPNSESNDKSDNILNKKLFWKFWKNIYEKCAKLKRLEKK